MIFLLVFSVAALEEDYVSDARSELDFNFNSTLDLNYGSSDSSVEYFIAQLKLFPREDIGQRLASLETFSDPEASVEFEEDFISFRWDEGIGKSLFYGIKGRVIVENRFVKVYDKIHFPIEDLGEELEFTVATENIDITEEIRDKANELVEGEDDLYEVVYEIADWVNTNVDYNLSTLTADVVQPSSWVFESREGVCDEITNLFISMLRSIGIPAKFVTGVSYTNVLNDWGLHGWAEVYFPEIGWVPFDVTYGEYGWLDSRHIKLQEGVSSGQSSFQYRWVSDDVNLAKDNFITSIGLNNRVGNIEGLVDLALDLINEKVGFESVVPIKVKVRNSNDYYVSSTVYVSKAPGVVGDNVKRVLLEPNSEKELFWLINVTGEFEEKYIYTSLIEVEDLFGSSDEEELVIAADYDVVEIDDAEANIIPEEEVVIERKIDLECASDKEDYYSDEKAIIDCSLRNTGNSALNDLDICIKNDCKIIDLGISQSKNVNFELDHLRAGRVLITAKLNGVVNYGYVNLDVTKVPEIDIISLMPLSVKYSDIGFLNFDLEVEGIANEVRVEVDDVKILKINALRRKQSIEVPFIGRELLDGVITVRVRYRDIKGKFYSVEEEFLINVVDIPWYVRILMFLRLM